MNIMLAIRLYLHAWIIDESADYRNAIRSAKFMKKGGEWFLRLIWVAGISWLPSAYQAFPIQLGSVYIHVHYLLLIILGFLFLWDFLMKSMIKSYSKEDKEMLIRSWVFLDLLMLLAIFIASLVTILPKTGTFNWLRIIDPLGYFIICGISIYQIIVWIPNIFRAPKVTG
jgi:hypothetical protein